MAYPSNKFPATAKFGSTGTITQPTDAYLLKGFVDEEPIPAEYLNHIVAYADAAEARLGNLWIGDDGGGGALIRGWDDDATADAPVQIKISGREGVYIESIEDTPLGSARIELRSENTEGTTHSAVLTTNAGTASTDSHCTVSINGSDVLVVEAGGLSDTDSSFRLPFSSPHPEYVWDLSPGAGGWVPAEADQTAVHAAHPGLLKRIHASSGAVSAVRPLPLPFYAASDASARFVAAEISVRFASDGGAAQPTVQLFRYNRSTGSSTNVATVTADANTAEHTKTTTTFSPSDLLDFSTYTYYLVWTQSGVASGSSGRQILWMTMKVQHKAAT